MNLYNQIRVMNNINNNFLLLKFIKTIHKKKKKKALKKSIQCKRTVNNITT